MISVAASDGRVARNPAVQGAARLGLLARSVVYLIIGWLAVQIASGHQTHEANQRGALAEIGRQSFGIVLLWAMGIGFAAYALWRLSEAGFGTATDGRKTGPRAVSLVRGLVYAGFSVTTFAFIAGTSNPQAQQQRTVTARVMSRPDGRWLVGLVGAIVVIVGLVMVVQGATRKFEKDLRMGELHGYPRTLVLGLGAVGTIARGIVFAIAGGLVVDAAIKFTPHKSAGLDGALHTLADQPYGPYLLGVLAFGLIAFGLYALGAARYAKT